jgi:choline kinase
LVPLRGKPLLEYQLGTLKACGVNEIVLVTGYKKEALASYNIRCYENARFDSTNMVYSLFCAEPEFNDDLIICYGDIVFEPRVLQALLACDSEFAVVVDKGWQKLWELRMEDPVADAESLKINSLGNITNIGQKVTSTAVIEGQYIGLIKISHACLSQIRRFYHELDTKVSYDGRSFEQMFMTTLIQRLIDSGVPVKAVCVEHGWLEVDTLSDLEAYESLAAGNALFVSTGSDRTKC